MIITINPDWRLASDPLQWAIQHRSGNEEAEREAPVRIDGDDHGDAPRVGFLGHYQGASLVPGARNGHVVPPAYSCSGEP